MKSTERLFLCLGALSAATGVGLGAFGAHGLRSMLTPEMLAIYETAIRYQMYHAFALLLLALTIGHLGATTIAKLAGWLFVGGIVIFSGSLYVLVLSGNRSWGAVTPIGGLFFIAGWFIFGYYALKDRQGKI